MHFHAIKINFCKNVKMVEIPKYQSFLNLTKLKTLRNPLIDQKSHTNPTPTIPALLASKVYRMNELEVVLAFNNTNVLFNIYKY